MPTYSYQCDACKRQFSLQMTMTEHDKKRVKCPKCGSRKARQQLGLFGVKTSKKS
ncbi:MAG TPA: zinc ribbon domain-containing protein [Candidatus Hydrogenedentes bacterium]|nr:zinc ribbon domain-containing protein [Candidatus Hydrogenedentota bacterium]HQH52824.1 zinc ribbon domain-containing protein [Candidatus Hydrogenedentota bacterium]